MKTVLIVLGVFVLTCGAGMLVGLLFDEDEYPETDYDAFERARLDLLLRRNSPSTWVTRTEARDTDAR